MTCRCSPSLLALRDQLDATFPHRSIASDGCCGDARHQREVSDHNPDAHGYAHAFDITQDPAHGVDCSLLAVSLIADRRMKYVIWNRRIYDPAVSKTWRHYRGADPHTGHLHLSILPNATFDTSPWPLGPASQTSEDDVTSEQADQIIKLLSSIDAKLDTHSPDGKSIGALVAETNARGARQGLDLGKLKAAAGIKD